MPAPSQRIANARPAYQRPAVPAATALHAHLNKAGHPSTTPPFIHRLQHKAKYCPVSAQTNDVQPTPTGHTGVVASREHRQAAWQSQQQNKMTVRPQRETEIMTEHQ